MFLLKRHITLLLIAALSVLSASAAEFVLVIDPGHGGNDPGCVGRKTNEKTIVLDIGRRLGKRIEAECKDIKVVYTRKDDRFITLQKRADIANDAHGNLFLSLHVNDAKKNRHLCHGISVFTLGPDKSSRNLAVAMRENSVIELEPDYSTRYKGFDPKSAESYIVFEMTSNLYMRQSIDFAKATQRRLIKATGRCDRGVCQAGFWVLWSPNMPSVLAELEFIGNPNSEDYLCSEAGREAITDALFESVKAYAADFIRQNSDKHNTKTKSAKASKTENIAKNDAKTDQNKKGSSRRNRPLRSDQRARR